MWPRVFLNSPVCTHSWTILLSGRWMRSVVGRSSLWGWTSLIQQLSQAHGDKAVSFDTHPGPPVEVNLPESLRVLLLQSPCKDAAGPCRVGWARHRHIRSWEEPEGRKTHHTAKLELWLLQMLFLYLFISIGVCWLPRRRGPRVLRNEKEWGPFFSCKGVSRQCA